MNEDELKRLWQTQSLGDMQRPPAKSISEMKQKMRQFNRILFWRDLRELVACLIVIGWSGAFFCVYRHENTVLTQIGYVVLLLTGILIAVKLFAARRSKRAFGHPASVREFLSGELDQVDRQIRLLKTVLWWYLLPLFCGIFLVVIGAELKSMRGIESVVANAICWPTMGLVFWFIYRLNQRAVVKYLAPIRAELLDLLREIAETESLTSG